MPSSPWELHSCLFWLIAPSSPPQHPERLPVTDRCAPTHKAYDLLAANRTLVATYETQIRRVALLPSRRFPWAFVVADVEDAIREIDFLTAHDLLVDPRRRCLLHQALTTIIHAEPCAQLTPLLTILCQVMQFEALLQEFPLLIFPQSAPSRVQHGVQQSIITAGPPCFAQPRRLSPECFRAARKELEHMLEEDTVQPSNSNWASPLHMVSKAQDREWRA
ncbi:uncharacterized protein LOC123517388 [Portunus trituberculatus]|uniref:uncharacterized protein LOC123517388 n=1 Tax=Portunus trituberculatus TaxID=210409 RepID=UPI001E1D1090|nr:uncharacterized protein LOC123517388 [Portunus trituberculatus]